MIIKNEIKAKLQAEINSIKDKTLNREDADYLKKELRYSI